MRTTVALVASAAAGVVSALAFDPLAVPYAMVVGVAGLLVVVHHLQPRRARVTLAAGALYGLAFMAVLIWWMRAVSDGAYVALVLAQVPFLALAALGLRRAMRLRWWALWATGVWVGVEMLRGRVPFSGFPWGRLGHTAIDTPFESSVRYLGVPGTSALLFAVSAGLASLVIAFSVRRAVGVVAGIAAATVVCAVLPTGVAGPSGTRQFSLVQGDVPGVFLTWPRGEIFGLHVAETRRLADDVRAGRVPQPDVVLWPENATDIDPLQDANAAAVLDDLVADLGAPLLVGGILDGPTDTTALNAGLVWTADGPGEKYVKRRPVPYGEYVPFRQQLGSIVPRIDRDIPRDFVAGEDPGALTIGGTEVGDTICWDIAYDDVVRDDVEGGAEVMVVQTSNAAFTGTAQPDQQFKISRLRAIETGRWVLVPSTNGVSGIVDAHGDVVDVAPRQQPATLSASVPLATEQTAGVRWGREIGWLLVALGVVGFVGRAPRRR
ncbi:apolipoprotein N-acyltransferase [Aeromicrobium sp. IC_218]|uniref:apolipoprotein N-acyltransferase n=1 Tax=Aeromicrobium sp. IC_218 TaxID=2545468 RepID=UPI0013F3F527|nr:apolipoprotein N-acyltransferase [Aeromicrobium sp. IC_218]